MRRSALGRSFDVYYRDAERTLLMDRLNAHFVQPGSLAFDIGAHVGDRTASFRRLGARVVSVEPQPSVFRALRLIHGRDADVTLNRVAVGADIGRMQLHVNSNNPTVSTLSKDFVNEAPKFKGWEGQVWDTSIEIETTTLDTLIVQHGVPDFIKIDVEGHEHEALLGLSQAVPALSFEFTTLQRHIANLCLDRLGDLGFAAFNASLGETHVLVHDLWLSLPEMREYLAALPDEANSGDVYALIEHPG